MLDELVCFNNAEMFPWQNGLVDPMGVPFPIGWSKVTLKNQQHRQEKNYLLHSL